MTNINNDPEEGSPMTEQDPRPVRRTIDEVIARALYAAAVASLDALAAAGESLEVRAAVRAELAADIGHIVDNLNPAEPGCRVRFGWTWDVGARREREKARSLGVVVHVLHRDGTDSFELGRWRVRELCAGDGTPADTVETLRYLAARYGLGPVPDDPSALDALPGDRLPVLDAGHTTAVRLIVCALTTLVSRPDAPVGSWACCHPGGTPEGMEPTSDHREAHAAVLDLDPTQYAGARAWFLAELHRLTGRTAA